MGEKEVFGNQSRCRMRDCRGEGEFSRDLSWEKKGWCVCRRLMM